MLEGAAGYAMSPTRAARVLVIVKGVAARCCCRVLHHEAVKVVCALWHVGGIASCSFRCRVLLSDFSQKKQEA